MLTREQGQDVLRRWSELELDTDDPLVKEELSLWDFDADGVLHRLDESVHT